MKASQEARSMSRAGRSVLAGLAVIVLGLPAVARPADGPARRTRPDYTRDRTERPAASRPAPVELPSELRIVTAETAEVVEEESRHAVPRGDWSDRARKEADRMARELTTTLGRLEYYRIGFHRGVRLALNDRSLGRWDHLQGLRRGGRDPQAYEAGARSGAEAAASAAMEAARAQVEAQFLDLSRKPRRDPRYAPPAFEPERGWTAVPEIGEVLLEIDLDGVPGMNRRAMEAFRDWRMDPWELSRCGSHHEFYDGRWMRADRAFQRWLSDPVRSRVYRRLRSAEDRLRFENVFKAHFSRSLPRYFDRFVARAYDHGFDDGWDMGAHAVYEYSFRAGYAEGFNRAAARTAEAEFMAAYPLQLRRSYDREFDDWSTSVRPGFLAVRALDGDDDGVFRPGETVVLEYELANFGGGSGDLVLRVDGRHLQSPGSRQVAFRGRGVRPAAEPIRVAIRHDTPLRTRAGLLLNLGGVEETVGLTVSNPLEFEGSVAVTRIDVPAGSAVVVVRAANRSRRAVRATVDLAGVGAYRNVVSRDLGILEAGQVAEASFALDGMAPLDLLSGRQRADLLVRDGEDVQDRTEFRFPELATRLDDRALLEFLVALSRDPRASATDIAAARDLVLRRIRADWSVAVRARGNPYKKDLKRNGTATALGDLVQTSKHYRSGAVRPEVFRGLGSEIVVLAEDLPGVHPFLRKAMKKLARRIG